MKNLFALLLCLCTALSLFAQAPNTNYDPDWDGDGNLGVSDLLGFLGLFGDFDTDGDGVWDSVDECTDLSACNFDSNPTVPCSYDDAIGICGGICQEDIDGDGVCDWTCGADSVEFEGHLYPTTQIGAQCWFAESVRYLPEVSPANESNAYIPMAIVAGYFGNDEEEAQNSENYIQNGCVYNWQAVDEWNLCPTGWEVPGFQSGIYEELIEEVGGNAVAGLMLKSESWNGLDAYGFTFLPYPVPGLQGLWRSQIDNCGTGSASGILRFNSQDDVSVVCYGDQNYFQVRCVKSE